MQMERKIIVSCASGCELMARIGPCFSVERWTSDGKFRCYVNLPLRFICSTLDTKIIVFPSAFLRIHLCKEAAVSSQILRFLSPSFPFSLFLFPNAYTVCFQNLYFNVNRELKTSANLYSAHCRAFFFINKPGRITNGGKQRF